MSGGGTGVTANPAKLEMSPSGVIKTRVRILAPAPAMLRIPCFANNNAPRTMSERAISLHEYPVQDQVGCGPGNG
jgi:hypothetical protein